MPSRTNRLWRAPIAISISVRWDDHWYDGLSFGLGKGFYGVVKENLLEEAVSGPISPLLGFDIDTTKPIQDLGVRRDGSFAIWAVEYDGRDLAQGWEGFKVGWWLEESSRHVYCG